MQPLLYGELTPWYRLLDPVVRSRGRSGRLRRRRSSGAARRRAARCSSWAPGRAATRLFIKSRFRCTLTDISPEMWRCRARSTPSASICPVTCARCGSGGRSTPSSSTTPSAYMTTRADLAAVAATAFAHTRPGGAAVFAPDSCAKAFQERERAVHAATTAGVAPLHRMGRGIRNPPTTRTRRSTRSCCEMAATSERSTTTTSRACSRGDLERGPHRRRLPGRAVRIARSTTHTTTCDAFVCAPACRAVRAMASRCHLRRSAAREASAGAPRLRSRSVLRAEPDGSRIERRTSLAVMAGWRGRAAGARSHRASRSLTRASGSAQAFPCAIAHASEPELAERLPSPPPRSDGVVALAASARALKPASAVRSTHERACSPRVTAAGPAH